MLKPGDKRTVRKDLVLRKRYGGERFYRPMAKFIGKQVTICYINSENDWCLIHEDDALSGWTEAMFESVPVDDEKERQEAFMDYCHTIIKDRDKINAWEDFSEGWKRGRVTLPGKAEAMTDEKAVDQRLSDIDLARNHAESMKDYERIGEWPQLKPLLRRLADRLEMLTPQQED